MSTSLLYHAFGCRDYTYKSTRYEEGAVIFAVEPKKRLYRCPDCRSRDVIRKGKRMRRIQSVPIGSKSVWLDVLVPKLRCQQCSKRFEVLPPLPRGIEAIPRAWRDMLSGSAD